MDDGFDFFLACVGVIAFVLILALAFNESEDATKTCQEMMSKAQTRTDSLIVYGMKPQSKFTTCADRL